MAVSSPTQTLSFRERIVGVDKPVPLLDGRRLPYVNLDNAASTPPLTDVMEALEQFMPYYSSVHRGTGFKSRLSTEAYDRAHEIVAEFVGPASCSRSIAWRARRTPPACRFWSMPPSWPLTARLTCALTTTRNIWTSSSSPPTKRG